VSVTLPNPAPLMRLALAYRSSMVLFAAMDLDVFTGVAAGCTVEELAKRCQAQTEPLRLLLEACVAEGMLVADGETYRNSEVADAFLVRGRPTYAVNNLKYAENLYPAWGGLAELIRTGKPTIEPESILGTDKAKTRAFVLAMHERARGGIGSVLPHLGDFTGRTRLLDVGGGPGPYSMELVRRTPGLRSTVLDLPGVLEVTREIVGEAGLGDRIDLQPGDYLTSSFGTGYDAVLLSGMMHRETPDTCRNLLSRSFSAMQPGGMVVVSDVFFEDDRKATPPFAVYFALNMMLTSPDGSAHAKTEMARWVEETGFRQVEVRNLPPPNPHSIVVGFKP
jgi:hypothetical protein